MKENARKFITDKFEGQRARERAKIRKQKSCYAVSLDTSWFEKRYLSRMMRMVSFRSNYTLHIMLLCYFRVYNQVFHSEISRVVQV